MELLKALKKDNELIQKWDDMQFLDKSKNKRNLLRRICSLADLQLYKVDILSDYYLCLCHSQQ